MADIYSKEKRSKIMAAISGKETKPEIAVRKYLFGRGFRYRKNVTTLPGKPDIVMPKYRTVIFIHGCFWHGHSQCRKSARPTSNITFWNEKIQSNIDRDEKHVAELMRTGWNVIVIWECELKKRERFAESMDNLVSKLHQIRSK